MMDLKVTLEARIIKLMEKLTHCQEAEGLRSLTRLLGMRELMLIATLSYFL